MVTGSFRVNRCPWFLALVVGFCELSTGGASLRRQVKPLQKGEIGAGFSGLWSSRDSQVRRPRWRRRFRQRFGQVENESVVDDDLVSLPHGKAVACQAFSIRDV